MSPVLAYILGQIKDCKVIWLLALHYVKSSRWCIYSVYDSFYDYHCIPTFKSPDTYPITHQFTRSSTVYQPCLQAVLFDNQYHPKIVVRCVL